MPAVAWSTSLFAVAHAGLTPVVVDIDPETLCLRGAFDRPVLAVHLLGGLADVAAPLRSRLSQTWCLLRFAPPL